MAYVVTLPALRFRLGLAGRCCSGLSHPRLFGLLLDQLGSTGLATESACTLPAGCSCALAAANQPTPASMSPKTFFVADLVRSLLHYGGSRCTRCVALTRRLWFCVPCLLWLPCLPIRSALLLTREIRAAVPPARPQWAVLTRRATVTA